jgi:hypothetical protein
VLKAHVDDDGSTPTAENLSAKVLLEKYSARAAEKRVSKNSKGKCEKRKETVLEKMFGVCIMICMLPLPW